MHSYLRLLDHVLTHGTDDEDRTGVGTRRTFGYQLRIDLVEGFPLLTTKTVHWRSVREELLWFLSGSTDNHELNARGVTIWDEWATEAQTARFGREAGDLGPVYGHQWRNFGATRRDDGTYAPDGTDQIAALIESLRADPTSRRHVVTGWNPAETDRVALPPCHTLFQFAVIAGRLSCQVYQRSADAFLGVPFNIASYAALTHVIAHLTGLEPGELIHTFGDLHIYANHRDQVATQLTRTPGPLPRLRVDGSLGTIDDLTAEHLGLSGYAPQGRLSAPVAV